MNRFLKIPARLRAMACLAALACATPAQAAAGDTVIPAEALATGRLLAERGQADRGGYELVRSLTTEIGPRLAGSAADERARRWAIARFKALGYDKVSTEPVRFRSWRRGAEHVAVLGEHAQPLAITALRNSASTPAGGLDAEVVVFPNLDALKAADEKSVRGKIVFLDAGMTRQRNGADYAIGGRQRFAGPALASTKGAIACLVRSAATDPTRRAPHTGVTLFEGGAAPIPAAALSLPDADQLDRLLALGGPVRLHVEIESELGEEFVGANVVAEITGRTHPEQVVALGAHLDSWDLGTGAIDDGAGIAIVMEAGKLILGLPQRPERSIRVVAFAAEEIGLGGGDAYAQAHGAQSASFQLMGESDFGADRIWSIGGAVKPEARQALQQIVQVLAPLGVAYAPEPEEDVGPDFGALHARGAAALVAHQDGTRYFDIHHSADDTLDKIDPAALQQNVAVYAAFAWMAANAVGDFGSK